MQFKIQTNEAVIDLKKEDAQKLDLIEVQKGSYHVIEGNRSYQVNLLHSDFRNKVIVLDVNGEKFELKISDEYDQLIEKMGLGAVTGLKIKEINAPMPGLVLDIMVEPGQEITKGDPLLILEAMKMENILKAQGTGIVKSIEISKGDAVDKGQVMIEME